MKQLSILSVGLFLFSVLASASTPSIETTVSELEPDAGACSFRYENGDWKLLKNQCREGYNPASPKDDPKEVQMAEAEGSCESL